MQRNEARNYILTQFLSYIFEISDREYQLSVWIRGEGLLCSDFNELVCHFFDDGDPILESYKDYGITNAQYELLKKFREEFDSFCINRGLEDYLPQFFIDTPQ
jgi:hypothetical protein